MKALFSLLSLLSFFVFSLFTSSQLLSYTCPQLTQDFIDKIYAWEKVSIRTLNDIAKNEIKKNPRNQDYENFTRFQMKVAHPIGQR